MTDHIEAADHYRKLLVEAEVGRAEAALEAALAKRELVFVGLKSKYGMGDADTYDGQTLLIKRAPAAPPPLAAVE